MSFSPLDQPLPLPEYTFDATLSDDTNFLVWAVILCRYSSSRKGHMACLLVKDNTVISYANNTPLLFSPLQKKAPEIHAECLAVCRAAKNGTRLENATCYVTAPPCCECFQSLSCAGIQRVVHLGVVMPESVKVAAKVLGVELVGVPWGERGFDFKQAGIDYWAERETADTTRSRVDAWWEKWMQTYKQAASLLGIQSEEGDGASNKNKNKKRRLEEKLESEKLEDQGSLDA
ncbi:hypothetical protein HDU98_007931 [Podochytrium sp. JEL0797]|nr:hypothetical protein HDU98_007931 [Podochytrium sp. JEL0797]